MVTLPYVKQEIPLIVLFRALGQCETDRQILSFVTLDADDTNSPRDEDMAALLSASLDMAFPIQNEEAALNFIGSRALKPGVVRQERLDNARRILAEYFLPSLGITAAAAVQKTFFLGYMVNRLLSTALGRRDVDDRDHYGHRRLDMVGPLFSSLFRTLFAKMTNDLRICVQKKMDAGKEWDIHLAVRQKTISDGLRYSLATGNWGDAKKAGAARSGISQVSRTVSRGA